MTFKVDDDIQARLDELGATYRCIAQARQSKFKAEVIDVLTKQVFGEGEGVSKQLALEAALANTHVDDKPQTPAQIAAENKMLRERLAALENREIKVEGKPTRKAGDKEPVNSVSGKKVPVKAGDPD